MTAKELFAVIVRAVGLVMLVVGILGLGIRVIDHFFLPTYLEGYQTASTLTFAFVTLLGVAMLLGAMRIVRLVYGPQP